MLVSLSIKDDTELRNLIKDMIRGQVASVAREEIKGVLATVIDQKLIPKSKEVIDTIVLDEIRRQVRQVLNESMSTYFESKTFLQDEVRKIIREEIKTVFVGGRNSV
jgi:hypothetical protein